MLVSNPKSLVSNVCKNQATFLSVLLILMSNCLKFLVLYLYFHCNTHTQGKVHIIFMGFVIGLLNFIGVNFTAASQ